MIQRQTSKEYIKSLNSLKFYCRKYIWDLPEFLRKDLSMFIMSLDKEIVDEKIRVQKYNEKMERMQMTIYDFEV